MSQEETNRIHKELLEDILKTIASWVDNEDLLKECQK